MNYFKAIKYSLLTGLLLFNLLSHAQNTGINIQGLTGSWRLDMSPENPNDDNFAIMEITRVTSNSIEGEFYRPTVPIREGRINTQLGIIYGALVSGDNSGTYNSTFCLKNGILYGTTHSLDRDFLAVWTATKTK